MYIEQGREGCFNYEFVYAINYNERFNMVWQDDGGMVIETLREYCWFQLC